MKIMPYKLLKIVYIILAIIAVVMYTLSLIFKRAIINNIDSFDKFINTIAKDGKIDIEGIVDEEIEIIKSIPNFDFNIPVLGNGNISNGNITLSIPFINKGIMFNQSDLETFRQLLTK